MWSSTRGRMPRGRLVLLTLAVLMSAGAIACSSGSADVDELEARVATLEAETQQLREALQAQAGPAAGDAAATSAATPAPLTSFHDFGFSLPIPAGVEVRTAGIGSDTASSAQGQLTASAGGVSMVLLWTSEPLTPQTAVQSAFEVLQAATPNRTFAPVQQGDIAVDGQAGAYGAFTALDADSTLVGIGLISGWQCGAAPTFSMTVVGVDQAAVESSFAGFTEQFKCS